MPSGPVDLSSRRCANHNEREAIARCLRCGGFFCRECVTEHDGRLTCAVCLAKLPEAGKRPGTNFVSTLAALATFAIGLLIAWVFFYYVGWFLLGLSDSFHEGHVW
jgi:hypothetical protein